MHRLRTEMLSSLLKLKLHILGRETVVEPRFSIITILITMSFFSVCCVLFNLMEIILLHLCVLNQNVSLYTSQITFEDSQLKDEWKSKMFVINLENFVI